VVLMDIRMPGLDGVAATAAIREAVPGCQVLVLTTFDDDEYIVAALRAGAAGYMLKDIPAADLAQAIHAVQRGVYQLDATIAGKMVAALTTPPPGGPPAPRPAPAADLSSREIEVLRLIAQGASNREIAEHLVISEGTVKNHISNILSRLGLRDRTQAALYAREKGLL
jgi:DNA-binding NarL/FixJ family response regulator